MPIAELQAIMLAPEDRQQLLTLGEVVTGPRSNSNLDGGGL